MKKLVIFLIPLIVSIPAFAKEKSSFAENFSLIKHSRAINSIFLKPEISLPDFGIATTGDKIQNWRGLYYPRFGQQKDTSPEEESDSLAEFYLKRTAEKYKKRRKIGGTIAILGGCGYIVLGSSMTSQEPDDWLGIRPVIGTLTIIIGAAAVAGGIYSLSVPGRAEREYNDVLSISVAAERERASHEALSMLAARGRKHRIWAGILSAAYSVECLLDVADTSSEYNKGTYVYVGAAVWTALAVYSFVVKSPAERAFEDYLKERKKEQQKKLQFRLGVMPYGGVIVGFVYSF